MFKYLKGRSCLQYLILLFFACILTGQATAQQNLHLLLRQKLAPGLESAANRTPSLTVRVKVKNKPAFTKWMQEQQVQAAVSLIEGKEYVVVSKLDAQALQKLLQNPWTEYVDRPNRSAKEELELRDADFTVNKITTIHSKYPGLHGEGLAVSVKEAAFDPNDIDLKGRVLEAENNRDDYSIHATTMATIIAGAGNSGPDGKGVAYRARVAYSDFADLLPDSSPGLLAKGISVQNHSYGVGVENYYGIEAAAYDKQVYENPQLLHIFSSGNSGNAADEMGKYAHIAGMANLTGQFKTSKNTLSVGALDPGGNVGALSSKGPAYDGRVKPELVAHGAGGTSEAAAVVSGIALLVQQAYAKEHGGMLPPAALVKAALINSADDVGRPAVDFESGFGNADAFGAVRAMQQQRFLTGTIANGQEKKFTIAVPKGATMVKVTLVWHEAEASPASQAALINDLDLSVRNPVSARIWKPWTLSAYPHPDSLKLPAKRGTDRINNIEQVTINVPTGSTYDLLVHGFQIPQGTQEFSIVYEFKTKTEWLFPATNSSLLADQFYLVSWQTNKQEATANLEYKYVTDNTWKLVQQNISLADNNFTWETPDTVAVLQLRLVNGTEVILSEPFAVTKRLELKVGFLCDNQVMVHWSKLPNVQHYQLYQMGDMYLEPLLTTPDTLAILDRTAFRNLSEHLAVAPVVQNKVGYSSTTLSTDQVGVACYIKSFLPRQFVLKQALLQLELSSLHDLATVTLERKTQDGYQGATTLYPSQLYYELFDPNPVAGKNIYRIKLTTTTGKVYYSHEEEIIYASENYVQVYPNPVVAGEPLSVVVASASARIQVFDRTGKLMFETMEGSVIKSIPTANLPNGLYIVRILTEEGFYLSARVIIF